MSDYNNKILSNEQFSVKKDLFKIIIENENGILKFNYNKINFQKGPFYPEFHSKPFIINIMSLVNEEIQTEINEEEEEKKKKKNIIQQK